LRAILGIEGLGHYTIAMAYLNVSQVISELGLPALLVRDLAQAPWRRRSTFRGAARNPGGDGLSDLGCPGTAVAVFALWGYYAHLLITGRRFPPPVCRFIRFTDAVSGRLERMELVMGVEVFINTLILALSVAVMVNGAAKWR